MAGTGPRDGVNARSSGKTNEFSSFIGGVSTATDVRGAIYEKSFDAGPGCRLEPTRAEGAMATISSANVQVWRR